MHTEPHPSEAASVPELIRVQMARSFPGQTLDHIAGKLSLNRHTVHAWRTGKRRPGAAALRDLLTRLGAEEATITAALLLLSRGGA
jgi:transcriptional regulator with XRE-family HTH domain